MAQIKCSKVSLGYEGQCVTEDIKFEVNKGDYLCIVGENGSGKSTLVKALLGVISPIGGHIEISDVKIGYLPQQTDVHEDFPASVKEVIMSAFAGKFKIFYGREEKDKAFASMKKLGIEELAQKNFRDLSGGQKQRVLLARALCAASDVLLLDEPVTGLDPSVTAELYDILKDMNRKEKITVITVSHDIEASLKYATKILHIGNKQLFFGSCEEYKKSDAAKIFSGSGCGQL